MNEAEDRARMLARMRRDDPGYVRRRRWLVLLAAVVVVVVAGSLWRGLGDSVATEAALSDAPGPSAAEGVRQAAMQWWLGRQQAQLLSPSADDTSVDFEVEAGESLKSIAGRLEEQRLIRDATTFRLLARARGVDRDVQAGSHTLRRNMAAQEILESLLVASGPEVGLTIPEGLRTEEVTALLAAAGIASSAELQQLVSAGITGGGEFPIIPAGATLEGYLFPDTYQLSPDAGARRAIAAMLDALELRFTPEMRARADSVGLTVHEVLTLASIVEREAVVPRERAKIARVFLNRLASPPFLLSADPTVQYALGYDEASRTWWKRWLTADDLEVDSPYNTYRNAGLPPGPIANPGLASIEAVLEPEAGDWMYFVANDVACDGTHVFATTLDEHVSNVATYQNQECRAAP